MASISGPQNVKREGSVGWLMWTTKVCKECTEAFEDLWEDEFFSTWNTKGPVVEALGKKGNHFSDARARDGVD